MTAFGGPGPGFSFSFTSFTFPWAGPALCCLGSIVLSPALVTAWTSLWFSVGSGRSPSVCVLVQAFKGGAYLCGDLAGSLFAALCVSTKFLHKESLFKRGVGCDVVT